MNLEEEVGQIVCWDSALLTCVGRNSIFGLSAEVIRNFLQHTQGKPSHSETDLGLLLRHPYWSLLVLRSIFCTALAFLETFRCGPLGGVEFRDWPLLVKGQPAGNPNIYLWPRIYLLPSSSQHHCVAQLISVCQRLWDPQIQSAW